MNASATAAACEPTASRMERASESLYGRRKRSSRAKVRR
jgi:hypothetical protein